MKRNSFYHGLHRQFQLYIGSVYWFCRVNCSGYSWQRLKQKQKYIIKTKFFFISSRAQPNAFILIESNKSDRYANSILLCFIHSVCLLWQQNVSNDLDKNQRQIVSSNRSLIVLVISSLCFSASFCFSVFRELETVCNI